jgi:hypothetical protein
MKVKYRKLLGDWKQKLLCVTHTDRPVEKDKCNLNYLELRYSNPNRLPPNELFDSLSHACNYSPYKGEITIWEFVNNNYHKPQLLCHLRPESYKPQSAIWYKEHLWVLGIELIEVYDSKLKRLAVIEDPWLADGHTIIPDGKGHLYVSCSSSDSVLIVDEKQYKIISTLRMPERLYGFNYQLSRGHSVVEHYIANDYQLTHINSAQPWKNGILVTTLIQGAIGWFDGSRNYKELIRGFVGCHGGRIDTRSGQIYFSDSCQGSVIFLDDFFRIHSRVSADSIWLHDCQQLDGNIFALSVSDRNQIEIMDFMSRDVIAIIPGDKFGNSTQFIYYGK